MILEEKNNLSCVLCDKDLKKDYNLSGKVPSYILVCKKCLENSKSLSKVI